MANSLICTNPDCERTVEYPDGSFQVICSHCNTWHLAPSEGNSNSNPNTFEPDGGYSPEPEIMDIFPPSDVVPEEIELEQTAQNNLPEEEIIPQLGYIITEPGEKFPLKEGKNIIGRKGTDIVISDKTISRRHCIIEANISDDKTVDYLIYDIGHEEEAPSTNGVFISGRSIRLQDYERVPLPNGTTVRVGNVSFQLRYG